MDKSEISQLRATAVNKKESNYDKKNGNEYKKYVLKINDICGKEIHSVDVFVKNSEETKPNTIDDEGLKGWQIALICVGAVIIVILIGFFVFRNLRRKKEKRRIRKTKRINGY